MGTHGLGREGPGGWLGGMGTDSREGVGARQRGAERGKIEGKQRRGVMGSG